MEELRGRRVVVIGGSSGIGLAVTQQLAAAGAEVAIAGRDAARLQRAATKTGARSHQLDVTDEAAVERFFTNLQRLDHLVTPAAVSVSGALVSSETADLARLVDSKFWGQYFAAKHAAPHLSSEGSITMFSGIVAHRPAAGNGAFAAVGAAVEAMARTLANELAPIRVNTIVPGIVRTPAWDQLVPATDQAAFFEQVASTLPLGRVGSAEDVAAAVLFAMTNPFLTGASIPVDGGFAVA